MTTSTKLAAGFFVFGRAGSWERKEGPAYKQAPTWDGYRDDERATSKGPPIHADAAVLVSSGAFVTGGSGRMSRGAAAGAVHIRRRDSAWAEALVAECPSEGPP